MAEYVPTDRICTRYVHIVEINHEVDRRGDLEISWFHTLQLQPSLLSAILAGIWCLWIKRVGSSCTTSLSSPAISPCSRAAAH